MILKKIVKLKSLKKIFGGGGGICNVLHFVSMLVQKGNTGRYNDLNIFKEVISHYPF